ncbi:inositol 2-dehydrogenase [Microbacterium sp.]|uniref:inositol 2-dehydrogenase n=1 Tax=Microbacterium sp. TaxID=51671 RepID=UPI003C7817D7
MTGSPLRFGLIGSGRIGQVHAAGIAADADAVLAWVADPFVDGAHRLVDQYGGQATDDVEDLFVPGRVDAVLIASPTPTHVGLIARSIERGLPVLCEKPIDLDIARVDALRSRVRAAGVPVALGFNRRFDPGFAQARERVGAGEIGRLEQLTIISRDPAAPPASYVAVSGGIFRDMTIHDFDMARFFLPDVVEVQAVGTCTFDPGAREHGDFDTAVTVLRSSTGAVATIVNSRHSAVGYDQRIEVFGSEGTLEVANQGTSLVSVSHAGGVETRRPYEPSMAVRYAASYRAELHEFIRLARGEASTSPTFEDGRAALLLADAAQRSAHERVVVPVDLT